MTDDTRKRPRNGPDRDFRMGHGFGQILCNISYLCLSLPKYQRFDTSGLQVEVTSENERFVFELAD